VLWKGEEEELEAGQAVGAESQCGRLWPRGNEFVRARPLKPGGMNGEKRDQQRGRCCRTGVCGDVR